MASTAILQHREHLPEELSRSLADLALDWVSGDSQRRLWNADETLWTSGGEQRWLGWLQVIEAQLKEVSRLRRFAERAHRRYRHTVLLGMGGSSLCAEVLRNSFGARDEGADLLVMDSTDPGEIRALEASIDLESTLFISASKSGTTLETALLTRHFLESLEQRVGRRQAGRHFVAVTDPGSRLADGARERGFAEVFHGIASIGGRYSALSHFGMVPAAVLGVDVRAFLEKAQAMQRACGPASPSGSNPGLRLGLVLAAAARAGRDKLTLVASRRVAALGAWIEQLLAESTGKEGRGIVPVDGEGLGPPGAYGHDRIFVHVHLAGDAPVRRHEALGELVAAGHPLVEIRVRSLMDLGQEFFRWEMATAVLGSVLGINPFDQPDVESAKVAARELVGRYRSEGSLGMDALTTRYSGVLVSAPGSRPDDSGAPSEATLRGLLRDHFGAVGPGDYIGVLAFLPREPGTEEALQRMRLRLRDAYRVATTVGFGPRYLHSTGQLHKGGPNSGVFLVLTAAGVPDLDIRGHSLSFGVARDAQALGEVQVLHGRGRRLLHLRFLSTPASGLARLEAVLGEAIR